jgi:hypothetical protein
MSTNQINSQWINLYEKSFRKDAHQLLAWGYQDSLSKIHVNLQEEEITGFIGEAIEGKLNDGNTDERFDRYFLNEEKFISSQRRTGKARLRLDIVIQYSGSKPRPVYIFEAKRLRKGSHSIGGYTGQDGMQCFIDGRYASQYPEAAMIGYLQSDDYSYWEQELNRKFNQDTDNKLQLNSELSQIEIISSLPHEYFSQHQRVSGNSIIIYHIFLDCCRILSNSSKIHINRH